MALLAPYPSSQARKFLPPSQAASLNETISKALQLTLGLPPAKLEVAASSTFVASYARDAAHQALDSLIWDTETKYSTAEKSIRKLTLQLAESLASSARLAAEGHGIDLHILLSLSVAFARTHARKICSIVQAAIRTNSKIIQDVENDLVPSFTTLLSADQSSPSHGLYAIRKTAHTLLSFVRVSPPEAIRSFAYNKDFILALATMYDYGLAAIATGYGGISVLRTAIPTDGNAPVREPDDWERIWVSTKVAFIDAFHTILSCILDDLTSSTGDQLGITSERAFDIVFALVEIRPSSSSQQMPPTQFLNQPLLTDYQRTYRLSDTLAASLRHAAEKDPRLDLLESTLQALDGPSGSPGALKILLRSSGLAENVRYSSPKNSDRSSNRAAGKAKAVVPENELDPDLDIKVTQVLEIFPSHTPAYVRVLLAYPPYGGSAEKVIEGLLEGTAPEESGLVPAGNYEPNARDSAPSDASLEDDITRMVRERKNVFDDEIMDLSKLRIGKKTDDAQTLLRDRAHIDHMKADILRRVQEMDLEDAEDEEFEAQYATTVTSSSGKGKEKAMEAIPGDEVELDNLRHVKIAGDGESDNEGEESTDEDEKPPSVETMLELAYIRDPKLFDRDSATRRSTSRADLKAQTGWADEQIEGWRIMLERNPRKDKILEKHVFSGNQNLLPSQEPTRGDSGSSRGRGRGGGGRGVGRGRGRGGGGASRGGGSQGAGDNAARERAWKDKHKSSRANHNRKRGHDKKMAKAGAGPPG